MKLSTRDKAGLGFFIGLLVVFLIVLYFTFRQPAPRYAVPEVNSSTPENSFVVKQRVRNIQKGRH